MKGNTSTRRAAAHARAPCRASASMRAGMDHRRGGSGGGSRRRAAAARAAAARGGPECEPRRGQSEGRSRAHRSRSTSGATSSDRPADSSPWVQGAHSTRPSLRTGRPGRDGTTSASWGRNRSGRPRRPTAPPSRASSGHITTSCSPSRRARTGCVQQGQPETLRRRPRTRSAGLQCLRRLRPLRRSGASGDGGWLPAGRALHADAVRERREGRGSAQLRSTEPGDRGEGCRGCAAARRRAGMS